MLKKFKLKVYRNHSEQEQAEKNEWLAMTPEERLDLVEQLRLEAGKFLYEYPARLRRVVTVTRKT